MEEKRKGGKEERRERGREAKTGVREEKYCNGGKEERVPERAGGGGREEGVKESGYEGWEGCMIGVQSEHHGCPKPHPLF